MVEEIDKSAKLIHGQAARSLRSFGLKYRKSGGGWSFCAGMSNPSALST